MVCFVTFSRPIRIEGMTEKLFSAACLLVRNTEREHRFVHAGYIVQVSTVFRTVTQYEKTGIAFDAVIEGKGAKTITATFLIPDVDLEKGMQPLPRHRYEHSLN